MELSQRAGKPNRLPAVEEGAAFMVANTRAGSLISSTRVIIRNRNGDPRTMMRKIRSELRS